MEEEKALAQIHVGRPEPERDGNILTPYCDCVVITTSGQIWDIRALAFTATKDVIQKLWDTDRSHFRKRDSSS